MYKCDKYVTYDDLNRQIWEHANQEVLRHLRALLFDSRVHDKWSFEQLTLVQRIMNTVDPTYIAYNVTCQ
jgi:hypothetical protein